MSTPTPSPIPNTGLNNVFSFIGNSTAQVELLLVGGFVVTLLLIIIYVNNHRR
jgi:hypothetical protein